LEEGYFLLSRIAQRPFPIELRDPIRRVARVNPLRAAPRIQAELRMRGFNVAGTTATK